MNRAVSSADAAYSRACEKPKSDIYRDLLPIVNGRRVRRSPE